MYVRLPTDEEANSAGFAVSDYEVTVDVWPENWPVIDVFGLFDTQWRTGMNGPDGLDYQVVYATLDRRDLAGDDWWQMLSDVRVMERSALMAMREK